MKMHRLGRDGPLVSALGLGCMGMSMGYGAGDDTESIATIHHALDRGVTLFDTANVYGPLTNERLLGQALKGRRDEAFIATKFGIRGGAGAGPRGVDGSPEYVRKSIDGSLERLGVDVIDLYYLHRVDPDTPIEDTVGAMAELVKAGKVRYIGLSEASAATLERACKVHQITALQSEYSLWTRDPEGPILETCRRLGIGFVPFSPLGRGFLSGELKSFDDFEAGDMRRSNPRFQGENFQKNLGLVEQVAAIAAEKGATASQLALAWVLAQGDDIVPIPGTKRRKYLDENLAALDIVLTPEDLARINTAFPPEAVAGPRYPEGQMQAVNR